MEFPDCKFRRLANFFFLFFAKQLFHRFLERRGSKKEEKLNNWFIPKSNTNFQLQGDYGTRGEREILLGKDNTPSLKESQIFKVFVGFNTFFWSFGENLKTAESGAHIFCTFIRPYKAGNDWPRHSLHNEVSRAEKWDSCLLASVHNPLFTLLIQVTFSFYAFFPPLALPVLQLRSKKILVARKLGKANFFSFSCSQFFF